MYMMAFTVCSMKQSRASHSPKKKKHIEFQQQNETKQSNEKILSTT